MKTVIAIVLAVCAVFGGLLWLMKPDEIVEVADLSGAATVAVYGKTIHLDPGPAGYKHVFHDRNTGTLKTTLVTGIPRRGLMLAFTRDSDERETRIYRAVYRH